MFPSALRRRRVNMAAYAAAGGTPANGVTFKAADVTFKSVAVTFK